MFKTLIATVVLVSHFQVMAQSMSNDFSRSDTKKEMLSTKDIRNRFELHGEIYVTDGKGKLLYQGNESRMWKFGSKGDLIGNWSFQSPDIKEVALRQTWTLSDDGKITAHIQQFESIKRKNDGQEIVTGKLLREEKVELKDFAPVVWIARESANERVVVRLVPQLSEKADFIEVDTLPITLNDSVMFDNKGRLWANNRYLEGRFVAMKTHLGQVAFSYSPFKGAKEIGFVKGGEVTINADPELRIYLRSTSPILASSKPAKIYGFVDMKKKSDRVNSVYSSASSGEKEFLENLR